LATPDAGGACESLRYFQSRGPQSGAVATKRPTQSRRRPGPFATVTCTLSPAEAISGRADTRAPAARSSFRIVPWPCASPSVAPTGDESVTKNVSSGSTERSPLTATESVRVTAPGAKLTEPAVAT